MAWTRAVQNAVSKFEEGKQVRNNGDFTGEKRDSPLYCWVIGGGKLLGGCSVLKGQRQQRHICKFIFGRQWRKPEILDSGLWQGLPFGPLR